MDDLNTSAHFDPEVWSKRKLQQQAQKAIIEKLMVSNDIMEDDMKMEELSKPKPFVASFSPPRESDMKTVQPEWSSNSRVITGGQTSTIRKKFLQKGKSIRQKKTRYELAQEKKREREMNKNKKVGPKPNKFRENIEKWQALDRQRWEESLKRQTTKKKTTPQAKPCRPKRIEHAFDDIPIPTAVQNSPQSPIDSEEKEMYIEETPEIVNDNNREIQIVAESEIQAAQTPAPRPKRKKYPACSHHVSSIFPYERTAKKRTIQSQQTKLVQQRIKKTEDMRRIMKEHEEEMHKQKRKYERVQKENLRLKMENKALTSSVNTMKDKLNGFESTEGKCISEERKKFIGWKKEEMKKMKKLQRELDAKAKLILNIPNKQLRRDIQDLKEKHEKKVSEMKDRQDRLKAHNDSLRKKVQHLETQVKTLSITNERLTQANAEVLSNHAAKVLRPALAVIAKQNEKKKKEAHYLKTTISPPTKRKAKQKPRPFTPKSISSEPPSKKRRIQPKIELIYHPNHLTEAQQQSCTLHENEVPYESVERSQYTAHKYSDGSCVRVFTSGAVIRKFPDGTSLTQHENGDKEKNLCSNEPNSPTKCYLFTEHDILKIFFPSGKQWIQFSNGEFQEIEPNGDKTIFRDGKILKNS